MIGVLGMAVGYLMFNSIGNAFFFIIFPHLCFFQERSGFLKFVRT